MAFDSVEHIMRDVNAGWAMRYIHANGASLFFFAVYIHIFRGLYYGSYKAPREINWYVGVGLLLMMVGLLFTGTVLKWDQEAYEALSHFTWVAKLMGVFGVPLTEQFAQGVPLLSRIYMWHISLLPLLTIPLIGLHLFFVKHHQLSPLPDSPNSGKKIPFSRHLVFLNRAGTGVFLLVCVLALTIAPPLGDPPVAELEITKPPWQFVWMYALENVWVPFLVVAPVLCILFLLAVPIIDRGPETYWKKRPIAIGALVACIILAIALILWGKFTTMTHTM